MFPIAAILFLLTFQIKCFYFSEIGNSVPGCSLYRKSSAISKWFCFWEAHLMASLWRDFLRALCPGDPGPPHALTSTAPAADPTLRHWVQGGWASACNGSAPPRMWKTVVSVLPCSKHLIFYNIDRPRLLRQPLVEQLDCSFFIIIFKNPEINLKLLKNNTVRLLSRNTVWLGFFSQLLSVLVYFFKREAIPEYAVSSGSIMEWPAGSVLLERTKPKAACRAAARARQAALWLGHLRISPATQAPPKSTSLRGKGKQLGRGR